MIKLNILRWWNSLSIFILKYTKPIHYYMLYASVLCLMYERTANDYKFLISIWLATRISTSILVYCIFLHNWQYSRSERDQSSVRIISMHGYIPIFVQMISRSPSTRNRLVLQMNNESAWIWFRNWAVRCFFFLLLFSIIFSLTANFDHRPHLPL